MVIKKKNGIIHKLTVDVQKYGLSQSLRYTARTEPINMKNSNMLVSEQ